MRKTIINIGLIIGLIGIAMIIFGNSILVILLGGALELLGPSIVIMMAHTDSDL